MKVIDIINEEPLNRTARMGRDDSGTAGVAGAAAAAGVAADRTKGASGKSVSKEIGRDLALTTRFARKYRGEPVLLKVLARVMPLALKRGALKSIPLAGAIIGGYFAAQQLAKGSVGGAALEIASSVGSLWTSVPLTALIIARDVYDQVFMDPARPDAFVSVEQDMIQDPEGTTKRLGMIKDVIVSTIGDGLKDLQAWAKTAKS